MPDTSPFPPHTGILLLNLGTPDSPTPSAVGRYLKEFLMDKYVLDNAFFYRLFLVYCLIVPKRKKTSAEAYAKIWNERGSPLLSYSQDLAEKVASLLPEIPVSLAMRYGRPSLEDGIQELVQAGVKHVVLFPLYPQYAESSTRTSVEKCESIIKKQFPHLQLSSLPAFYDSKYYIDAVTEVSKPSFSEQYDRVLFSYHGLPERQLTKLDATKKYCLKDSSCCESINEKNRNCYRAHCYSLTRSLVKTLGIPEGKYSVAFQSRLGKTPWIKPYTDKVILQLAAEKKKRVLVMCPSFVADCLETLEEIAMAGKENFEAHGGGELVLVPSLNAEDVWAKAVVSIVSEKIKKNTESFQEGECVKFSLPQEISAEEKNELEGKIGIIDGYHTINNVVHYSVLVDHFPQEKKGTYFLLPEHYLQKHTETKH